jgi:probable F420-dependent oxidoreductase
MTLRIEFVTGILILPQRQTVLAARQAADLDLLSGGRFRMGVGIGWNPVEYDALGLDFHNRGRRLSEQVGLLRRLWAEPLLDFRGEFDRVDRAALNPRPGRAIPLWFGGFAEAAMRRAAVLGDGFIFAGEGTEQIGRLKQCMREAGRSEENFGFESNTRATTPQAVVDSILKWRDLGGTHCSVSTMGRNLGSVDAHIGHMKAVADALARSELK